MTAEARWQSGYAAACKAVDAGSIPTLASIFLPCPGGGIGRRSGLKIPCQKWRAGSSPALGTNSRAAIQLVNASPHHPTANSQVMGRSPAFP